jgi:hypothetical protein
MNLHFGRKLHEQFLYPDSGQISFQKQINFFRLLWTTINIPDKFPSKKQMKVNPTDILNPYVKNHNYKPTFSVNFGRNGFIKSAPDAPALGLQEAQGRAAQDHGHALGHRAGDRNESLPVSVLNIIFILKCFLQMAFSLQHTNFILSRIIHNSIAL